MTVTETAVQFRKCVSIVGVLLSAVLGYLNNA